MDSGDTSSTTMLGLMEEEFDNKIVEEEKAIF